MSNNPFIDDNFEDLVGKSLGKYQITEYVGFGGMATVYRAKHPILDREVAIKLLHNASATDTGFVKQFVNEAKHLASLHHPNIVNVFDIDVDGKNPYIVMEFIDGISLEYQIEAKKSDGEKIAIGKAIRTIQSVGDALAYAHKQGMLHRDIKPSNILIENTNRVVLADFGLATLQSKMTGSLNDAIQGTPAYLAPEQAMGVSGGETADIYSLGVVFYELVTGEQPYSDENPFELMMKHVNDPLRPPSELIPDIPEKVEAVILKAMERDSSDRYQTIDLMLDAIDELTEDDTRTRLNAEILLEEDDDDALPSADIPVYKSDQEVSLHFIDTGQILPLKQNKSYVLGRASGGSNPDIDLSKFSTIEWGISRIHAQIEVGNDVKIKDLNSSNGTRVEGKKISGDELALVKHGSIISLGKLRIQILIYD